MPLIQNFKDNLALQFDARQNDLERISKLLDPRNQPGATFAAKQALLRTSPEVAKLVNPATSAEDRVEAGRAATLKAAEAASHIATILAQVPVNGTGTHFLYNELLRLTGEKDRLYYAGTGNASNQANYGGIITISTNAKKMRGKSFDSRGLTEGSDDYNKFAQFDPTTTDVDLKKEVAKDTLPVSFNTVDNLYGEAQSFLLFRGFVTGLTDNLSAGWSGITYVGRNEPMYIYNTTTRTLGFRLQIPIFNEEETPFVYSKVNGLMSYMYGRYSSAGLNQGTLLKIRVGDYFRGYGVLTSMNHSVDTNIPWSSSDKLKSKTTDAPLVLPQVITLQVGMNIIHERLPERVSGEDLLVKGNPYIANSAKALDSLTKSPRNN